MKTDARSDIEQANATLVADFVEGWNAGDYDLPGEYRRYLHADGQVRMSEEHPMIEGVEGVIAAMQAFIVKDGKITEWTEFEI